MRDNQVVAVFTDVNNLFLGSQKRYKRRLDYKKFYQHLRDQHGAIRVAYAYGVGVDEPIEAFKALLRHSGFETKWSDLKINWNVTIALDAVRQLDKADLIVLGSGDPNLAPVADFIRNEGIKCYCYGFRISEPMKKACDRWFEINEDLLL